MIRFVILQSLALIIVLVLFLLPTASKSYFFPRAPKRRVLKKTIEIISSHLLHIFTSYICFLGSSHVYRLGMAPAHHAHPPIPSPEPHLQCMHGDLRRLAQPRPQPQKHTMSLFIDHELLRETVRLVKQCWIFYCYDENVLFLQTPKTMTRTHDTLGKCQLQLVLTERYIFL